MTVLLEYVEVLQFSVNIQTLPLSITLTAVSIIAHFKPIVSTHVSVLRQI